MLFILEKCANNVVYSMIWVVGMYVLLIAKSTCLLLEIVWFLYTCKSINDIQKITLFIQPIYSYSLFFQEWFISKLKYIIKDPI